MKSLHSILVLGLLSGFSVGAGNGPVVSFDSTLAIFPKEWRTDEINPKAVALPMSERARFQKVVDRAIAKYPSKLLTKHLKNVYLLRSITFFGLAYGGTNSLDAVYLANDGVANGYTDDYLEESFHHELSSIFVRNVPTMIDQKAWAKLNAPGYEYKSNGVESLKNGTSSLIYTDEWNERGFLCAYGSSSFEEDFNVIAGGMMTGRKDFWTRAEKFPRLKGKMELIVAGYQKLDPSLNIGRLKGFQSN